VYQHGGAEHPCTSHPHPKDIKPFLFDDLVRRQYCLLRGHGSVIAVGGVPEFYLDSLEMEENVKERDSGCAARGLATNHAGRGRIAQAELLPQRLLRRQDLGALPRKGAPYGLPLKYMRRMRQPGGAL